MEIAYLAEDTDGEQVLRALAGRFEAIELHEGDALPIEDELNRIEHVGAYVGVPVEFSDGHLYGSLCCLSHAPHPDVGEREVRFMRVLARVVAGELEREALHREAHQLKDDFVALVSHELRTPLASIIANLEVLEDETAAALARRAPLRRRHRPQRAPPAAPDRSAPVRLPAAGRAAARPGSGGSTSTPWCRTRSTWPGRAPMPATWACRSRPSPWA